MKKQIAFSISIAALLTLFQNCAPAQFGTYTEAISSLESASEDGGASLPPLPALTGSGYEWTLNTQVACATPGKWVFNTPGAWKNVSCQAAQRETKPTCQPQAATTNSSYLCRDQVTGAFVADALCAAKGAKPADQQVACSSTCDQSSKPAAKSEVGPAYGTPCQWSLVDQYSANERSCMTFNATNIPVPYGTACGTIGEYRGVRLGMSNDAVDIDGRRNTCAAGQGPVAVNTYQCVFCASGVMEDQAFQITNGDRNYNGATAGIRRRVCKN